MDWSEDLIRLFERYKKGDLDPTEVVSLKEKFEKDPEIKEGYNLYLLTHSALEYGEAESLKAEFDKSFPELINKYERKRKTKLRTFWLTTLTAAAVLFFVVFFLIPNRDSEDWISSIGIPPSVQSDERDIGIRKTSWDIGMKAYQDQKFEQAIANFRKSIGDNTHDQSKVYYYLGSSYLGLKKYDSAEANFINVSPTSKYADYTSLYLAVSLLEQGKDHLEIIPLVKNFIATGIGSDEQNKQAQMFLEWLEKH